MNGRAAWRGARVAAEIARAAWLVRVGRQAPGSLLAETSRRLLRILGVTVVVDGETPERGLMVCNHLSYLDVLVIASLGPARFVAKSDVRCWPVVGGLTARLGTIFADRARPMAAADSLLKVEAALRAGERVVLFPEGTSSGGASVLPFRSSLLEAGLRRPVAVACVSYALPEGDGDPAELVAYWKDMTFVPHLLRLMKVSRVTASLRFAPERRPAANRKELALQLRAGVLGLLQAGAECMPGQENGRCRPARRCSPSRSRAS